LAGTNFLRKTVKIFTVGLTRDLRGTLEKAGVVRGVYIAPVNWGEVAQSGYAAVMTERARAAAAGASNVHG